MRKLLILGVMALAGCETTGTTSKAAAMNISPGMSRDQVVAAMGPPGARSFRDNREALQYCKNGFVNDEYYLVMLTDAKVTGFSSKSWPEAIGSCAGSFPSVDWNRPDLTVSVRPE